METLYNDLLTINTNSFGAELSSIKSNVTGEEYLWQADPEFWKGSSPILFPIVGSLWEDKYLSDGTPYSMTRHGFARNLDFQLDINKPDEISYVLESSTKTLSTYPFSFLLRIGYKLIKNTIEVFWQVTNTGVSTMYFQIGAHPAFNYPDFNPSDNIKAYFSFNKKKNLEYLLIEEKGCIQPEKYISLELQDGVLPIENNIFHKDALIFENYQLDKVKLLDKEKQPYITVEFDTPVVGLWSPPEKNAPFVCIEPWFGRCDRVNYLGELKDRDWMNRLMPDEKFSSSYSIIIDKI